MKRRLDEKWYNVLKNMDFSVIENDITFDVQKKEFETDSEYFDVAFDEKIVMYGMDEKQENCTEYGRTLYMLYDLLFSRTMVQ